MRFPPSKTNLVYGHQGSEVRRSFELALIQTEPLLGYKIVVLGHCPNSLFKRAFAFRIVSLILHLLELCLDYFMAAFRESAEP